MTQSYFGELYGELYRRHLLDPERSQHEADFAARVLGLRGARVLDLAAGFGRHARILAKNNRVWALDRNGDYLRLAAQELDPAAAQNMQLACADMRSIPLRSATFDAAVLLFNSFGYFVPVTLSPASSATMPMWKLPKVYYERKIVGEDFGVSSGGKAGAVNSQDGEFGIDMATDENESVIRELARVLKPGGGFLLEIPNPIPLLAAVQEAPKRRVSTGEYEIEEEFSFDPASRVLTNRTRFHLEEREESGGYSLKLYERGEISAMLRGAGFVVKKTYGDYDATAYSKAHSEMILVHAKRK